MTKQMSNRHLLGLVAIILIVVCSIALYLSANATSTTPVESISSNTLTDHSREPRNTGQNEQLENFENEIENSSVMRADAAIQAQKRRRILSSGLDDIMAGKLPIVEYIREHLNAAKLGDPEAAYYVSRALNECAADIRSLSMTISITADSNSAPIVLEPTALTNMRPSLDAVLPNLSEFPRAQALRRFDRAVACLELGQADELFGQARELTMISTQAGHPLAQLNLMNVDWGELDQSSLSQLQSTGREMLEEHRDREVFFFAADISSASLGLDPRFEKVAWAIAACEYNTCDTLSRLYRGNCERMTLNGGGQFCTEDITDADYLVLKYPGDYDRARARAMEIKRLIDAEDWVGLGLSQATEQ